MSGGQPNANRKVEEWLQKQSTVATDMSSLPGKPDGPRDSTVVGSPSFTDNSLAMVGGRGEGGGGRGGGRGRGGGGRGRGGEKEGISARKGVQESLASNSVLQEYLKLIL